MEKEVFAVVISGAIILAFAAGFGASTLLLEGDNFSHATTSSSISTICTIPVEGDLVFQLLNSSTGDPIGSVPVQIQNLYPSCDPNPHTTANLGSTSTDANGTLRVSGLGEFYLTVNLSGNFFVEASVGPVKATCVTLSIPSGEVHISYSEAFEPNC